MRRPPLVLRSLHSPEGWLLKRPVDQSGRVSGGEPVWILPVAQNLWPEPG
jgi:hypothetical protein